MTVDTTTIVIILVVLLLVMYFLFYPSNTKESFDSGSMSAQMQQLQAQMHALQMSGSMGGPMGLGGQGPPMIDPVTNLPININVQTGEDDPYADFIKKTDLYSMYDPLNFPQKRMDRDVLMRYKEYYEKNGTYPPFGLATQGALFDNPIPVGYLNRVDFRSQRRNELDGCSDGGCKGPDHSIVDQEIVFTEAPYTMPLFMVKSVKNNNRYFYYTIDQKYYGKYQTKIPFKTVKLNDVIFRNVDEYGIPEVFDHDKIEVLNIYPGIIYNATIYKQNHFP